MSAVPALSPAAHATAAAARGPRLRIADEPALPRQAERLLRRASVPRPRLVGRLLAGQRRVAALTAPAGFGKSVLLAEWAAADPRPFAWASATAADDDPVRLLGLVARALGAADPVREAL